MKTQRTYLVRNGMLKTNSENLNELEVYQPPICMEIYCLMQKVDYIGGIALIDDFS